ncbi:HET-domain-containing protein [Coleophoma cylindrospora]|uniref:HET-domain-containing protein n=1 Tax=Coleophoma cylindrospora TaxID=1849047 RepID=A0A3D8RMM4_9HELO|nr:HET-domain-containing protein [Coleophoma cylindrospora]
MALCDLCSGFDIRALLLHSAAQRTEETGMADRNHVDGEDYRPPVPLFYAHYEGIVGLQRSSIQGCTLCSLLYGAWAKTLNRPDITEEWLEKTFQGPLYLGCTGWIASRQGIPYVSLTQKLPDGRSRELCHFEAFADREDIPSDGSALLGRAVYEDPSQEACLAVAADWIDTCLNKHEKCNQIREREKSLPTRAIDVGDISTPPKLVTTKGKVGTYIALSYCWGGDSTFVYNDKMAQDLKTGIALGEYPATLRDAIIITRALKIKYIWIDALCIKQDDPQDWAAEAAQMREVYSNAIISICAANSPTTRSGIFTTRKFELPPVELVWRDLADESKIPHQVSKVYLRSGSELWDQSLRMSVLQTRGWALQEGVLSPRTLSYGSQQMIWECVQYQADEGGRITRPTQDYRSKGFMQQLISGRQKVSINPLQNLLIKLSLKSPSEENWWKSFSVANPYDKWNDIGEQFMGRSLTKDFDVLPALAGIARAFHSALNDEYCAGLWKKEIICSLRWQRNPRYPADQSTRFDLERPSEYLAPSWSWASILGRQSVISSNWKTRDALKTSAERVAKVVKVHMVPKGNDPFGQVVRGELVLRGPFCLIEELPPVYSLQDEWIEKTPGPQSKSPFQRRMYDVLHETDVAIYEYYQQHIAHENQHFAAVEIVHWNKSPAGGEPGMDFLLLESTGEPGGTYRRIGHYGLRKYELPDEENVTPKAYASLVSENEAYDELMNSKWKTKTITII